VEIDTAKKGEVSRADFLKYRMKSFDELDANKDGSVTQAEYDVNSGKAFDRVDANKDGFITPQERQAAARAAATRALAGDDRGAQAAGDRADGGAEVEGALVHADDVLVEVAPEGRGLDVDLVRALQDEPLDVRPVDGRGHVVVVHVLRSGGHVATAPARQDTLAVAWHRNALAAVDAEEADADGVDRARGKVGRPRRG